MKGAKLKKIASRAFSVLCTLVLVFSVAAALLSVAFRDPSRVNFIGKYAVDKILTESMEPVIPTGEYILIEKADADELKEGDIITFYSEDPSIAGRLNTHAIVGVTEEGFVTKGENNSSPDTYPVPEENVVGRYVTTLGFLTNVLNIFSSPAGYFILIVLPLLLLVFFSMRDVLAALGKKEKAEENVGEGKEGERDRVLAELERMKESGELDARLREKAEADGTTPSGQAESNRRGGDGHEI